MIRDPRKTRYNDQMQQARRRGIEWLFTFEQWWAIWEPHWHLRGRRRGQYMMARHGDVGAYAPWNVSIMEATANRRQRRELAIPRCPMTGRYLPMAAA